MEMSVFAQSLARLHKAGNVTSAKIDELLAAGKITDAEAAAIKEGKQ